MMADKPTQEIIVESVRRIRTECTRLEKLAVSLTAPPEVIQALEVLHAWGRTLPTRRHPGRQPWRFDEPWARWSRQL